MSRFSDTRFPDAVPSAKPRRVHFPLGSLSLCGLVRVQVSCAEYATEYEKITCYACRKQLRRLAPPEQLIEGTVILGI